MHTYTYRIYIAVVQISSVTDNFALLVKNSYAHKGTFNKLAMSLRSYAGVAVMFVPKNLSYSYPLSYCMHDYQYIMFWHYAI